MCVAVCGGVGGGGEAGAKTASLLSGEERRKCEDTQSWGRGGGWNQCRLRCIRVWTCGCGLRVLGGVQAQKLLEQEYDRLELQLKPQMNHSFSSETSPSFL